MLGEGGEVVLEQRVATQGEKLAELLSQRPKARVLLEASSEGPPLTWPPWLEERGRELERVDSG